MGIYSVLLTVLVVALTVLVFTRSDVETLFLRAPGGMFTQLPDGRFQNLYTVKIVNKTSREIPITLKPENFVGEITTVGALNAPPQELVTTSVLVKLESSRMTGANTRLTIGVYSGDRLIETVDTAFIGPRSSNPNP
jgi:hypothetical protein